MSDQTFKKIPTVEEMAKRIAIIHGELKALAQACGTEVAQTNETLRQSTAITDATLEEMALQITFLMQTIRVSKPMHGGIADIHGNVPTEVKTASQIYHETGRAKLLEQIDTVKRAQGLPTAESPQTAAPEGSDASPQAPPEDAFTGPKVITH